MKKQNIPCTLKYDSGLTLAEVLVGMTIMVIALMPLMLMIAGGGLGEGRGGGGSGTFAILRQTRNVSKCLFIAQELLDEHVRILRNDFDSIGTNYTTSNCATPMAAANQFLYDEAPFRWSTQICNGNGGSGIPDTSGADEGWAKTIKITVWRDDNGDTILNRFEDSFTLSTKVTSREKNP